MADLDQMVAERNRTRRLARATQHREPPPQFKAHGWARSGYVPEGVPFADSALARSGEAVAKANEALRTVSDLSRAGPAALREIKKAIDGLANATKTVEQRHMHHIGEILKLTQAKGEFDAEVRAMVRASKNPDDLLRKMVRAGNPNAAAILRADPLLSGVKPETHALAREEAARVLTPELANERDNHKDALDKLRAVLEDLTQQYRAVEKQIHESDDARLARLFKTEEADA